MDNSPRHSFYIPVLGISYSVDTPLKVAQYGISSVVSIVDDGLLEDLRSHYCSQYNIDFKPIALHDEDYRAKRITAYLNLLKQIVEKQMHELSSQDFSQDNSLTKYFELLPVSSSLRSLFTEMLDEKDEVLKKQMQKSLRNSLISGAIDVNIMAKVDNTNYAKDGTELAPEYSDALSAFRGFAQSNLTSSVVLSAGYNPRLFSYIENFDDFFPDKEGVLRKKIILKVSDYRSALVQGKILAKKGVWVSEFRIESGLNCGGHAFATDGLLMGPILEEFKQNRESLHQELLELCNTALIAKNKTSFSTIPKQRIAAQGGIGTKLEHELLLSYYQLDGAGWGSPFLLVPEATSVDSVTLNQLATAKREDYFLSDASPLGVPFHNFRRSTSENQRKERIAKGRPGSPCYKKFLSSNTEFTENVICTSSRQYQHLKIKQLQTQGLSEEQLQKQIAKLEEKDCLCEGLSSSVRLNNGMHIPHKLSAVTICPGPNLAFFSGVFSLKNMVNHIYGRENLLNNLERPHMFLNELQLYVDYLKKKIQESKDLMNEKQEKYFSKFKENLLSGIAYYRTKHKPVFDLPINMKHLLALEQQLNQLFSVKELMPA